jgi:hypothetical protein
VWDVGRPADSASVQNPSKDSAQAKAKTELSPAKPDSSHVAKLDSLLTSTAKDKKASKKISDKKAGAKKKNNVVKEKNDTDEPENKSW